MSSSIILILISVLGLLLYSMTSLIWRSVNKIDLYIGAKVFLSFNILLILLIYKINLKSFIPTTCDFYTHLMLVLTLGIICRIIHIFLNFTFDDRKDFGVYFFKEFLNSLIVYLISIFIVWILYIKKIDTDTIRALISIYLSSSMLISLSEYTGFNVSDIFYKKNNENLGANSGTGNSGSGRGGSSSARGGSSSARGGPSSGRGDSTGGRSRGVNSGRISKDSSHIGSSSSSSGITRHKAVLSRDSIRTRDIHLSSPTLNELSRESAMQSGTNPQVYNTYLIQGTVNPQVGVTTPINPLQGTINPQTGFTAPINPLQGTINPQTGFTAPINPLQSGINPQMPITSFVQTGTNPHNSYFLQGNVNPQVPIAYPQVPIAYPQVPMAYPIQSGVYTQMPSTVNPVEGNVYTQMPSIVNPVEGNVYTQMPSTVNPVESGMYHPYFSQSGMYHSYFSQSGIYPQNPYSLQSGMYPQVPLSYPIQNEVPFVPHIQTGVNPFGFTSPVLQPSVSSPILESTENVSTPVVEPTMRPVVIPSGIDAIVGPYQPKEVEVDGSIQTSECQDERFHSIWLEKFMSERKSLLEKRPGIKPSTLQRAAKAAALKYVQAIILAEDNALYSWRQGLSPKLTPPRISYSERYLYPHKIFPDVPRDFRYIYPESISFTVDKREFTINYSLDDNGYISHPRGRLENISFRAGIDYVKYWHANPRPRQE